MFFLSAFIKLLTPILFAWFFLQTANVCFLYFSFHDYLRIASDTYNVIGTFCGQQNGTLVRVAGNYALLTFHTDPSVQKTGFELLFSYSVFPGELVFFVLHPTPRFWDFLLKEAENLWKCFATILLFIHKLLLCTITMQPVHGAGNGNVVAYFCEFRRNNLKRRLNLTFLERHNAV